jgi:hypothetical protein
MVIQYQCEPLCSSDNGQYLVHQSLKISQPAVKHFYFTENFEAIVLSVVASIAAAIAIYLASQHYQ